MIDIQPGDVVVCVDVGKSPEGFEAPHLQIGKAYTVYAVGVDPLGQLGLYLDEIEGDGFNGGFLAWRFRKIQKADESFTALIKRKRPSRQHERV